MIDADGELFVGTVADFSGMDPLIYREPLRTEQYDATNLNGTRLFTRKLSSSFFLLDCPSFFYYTTIEIVG